MNVRFKVKWSLWLNQLTGALWTLRPLVLNKFGSWEKCQKWCYAGFETITALLVCCLNQPVVPAKNSPKGDPWPSPAFKGLFEWKEASVMQSADGPGLFPWRSPQVHGTDEGMDVENEVSVGSSLAIKFCEDLWEHNWKSTTSFLWFLCVGHSSDTQFFVWCRWFNEIICFSAVGTCMDLTLVKGSSLAQLLANEAFPPCPKQRQGSSWWADSRWDRSGCWGLSRESGGSLAPREHSVRFADSAAGF